MFSLEPIHDRIIVKRLPAETLSKGGIVIPDLATEKPAKGEVVAIGDGRLLENGQIMPPLVQKGDIVLFGQHSGSEVKIDHESYLVMREEDIYAIIRGENS
jgi:chaperonin GroES